MALERASASEQIATALRAEIEAGRLRAGELLPSDAELARRFQVSKPTVTKARAMLVALGLVTSRAGAASIVRESAPAEPPPSRRSPRTRPVFPDGHRTTVLSARVVPAPPEVAPALALADGASVIQRRRIVHAQDETPLAISTTYFPGNLAADCPALLETRRIRQGTNRYIEEQTGREASSIAAGLTCAPGARKDTDALQLPPGSYVLTLSTSTHDGKGAAFAHEIEVHPPGTPIALEVADA